MNTAVLDITMSTQCGQSSNTITCQQSNPLTRNSWTGYLALFLLSIGHWSEILPFYWSHLISGKYTCTEWWSVCVCKCGCRAVAMTPNLWQIRDNYKPNSTRGVYWVGHSRAVAKGAKGGHAPANFDRVIPTTAYKRVWSL